ncbi:MAG: AAA family ATPase [Nannocystis sp.]|nr:AAA family ATPase [Nannocystis sp.]MBK9755436.1 AAA family ATPase [Nannocystis sp.]
MAAPRPARRPARGPGPARAGPAQRPRPGRHCARRARPHLRPDPRARRPRPRAARARRARRARRRRGRLAAPRRPPRRRRHPRRPVPRASYSLPVPSAIPPVPSASPPVPSASPPVPSASPPVPSPRAARSAPPRPRPVRARRPPPAPRGRARRRRRPGPRRRPPGRRQGRGAAPRRPARARRSCPRGHARRTPGLKAWLRRRALALHPAARAAAIADPRGVLLVGVQGCGKSLAARVCADILGLGLVRLDPGRLFGGTVGESEANLRRLTAAAERLAPVVLWIDELDKGLVGSEGAASDAGTAARVLGGLLTWLQERARPVFVVATANRVDALPPELLRRGRLDETFFVDLPGPDDRATIAEIHLVAAPQRRLGRAPPLADPLPDFLATARAADGLSGAEIEGAVTEARLDAFAEARPLAAADLHRALAATIPLSRSRAAEVAALRSWATRFARPA